MVRQALYNLQKKLDKTLDDLQKKSDAWDAKNGFEGLSHKEIRAIQTKRPNAADQLQKILEQEIRDGKKKTNTNISRR